MNITGGNITYGDLHVPFFWRVSNRTELNHHLVDVRGREGERGRGEEGRKGERGEEGGRRGREGGRRRGGEGNFSLSCSSVLQVVRNYNDLAGTSSFGSAQYNR